MPLTALQNSIFQIIRANRSPDSFATQRRSQRGSSSMGLDCDRGAVVPDKEVTGELFFDESTFAELENCGEITTHLAFVRADGYPSSVQILHYLAIAFAKKRIRIQNPYFLPDPHGADALARAAKRGADRKTTEDLDAIFEADLADCKERNLEDWNDRPLWKRLVERFHYLFNEQF